MRQAALRLITGLVVEKMTALFLLTPEWAACGLPLDETCIQSRSGGVCRGG
jgi:hypothetical protein